MVLSGLLLIVALSGCVGSGPDSDMVKLPEAPATLNATYTYNPGEPGASSFPLRVQFELVANGQQETRSIMDVLVDGGDVAYSHDGSWTFHQRYTLRSSTELKVAHLWCEARDTSSCLDRGQGWMFTVPDALGAPSFLGLGPFLGRELQPGQTQTTELWDASGPVPITWRVTTAPPRGQAACVWLESDLPPSGKTLLPLAPFAGRLLACDGSPVPHEIRLGHRATIRLLELEHHGRLELSEGPPSMPSHLEPRCHVEEPATNNLTLPTTEYATWAVESDPGTKRWLDEHPEGRILPGFAVRLDRPDQRPGLTYGWGVSGKMGLHDPATGSVEFRTISKTVRGDLLEGESEEMQESRAIIGSESRVPVDLEPFRCGEPKSDMKGPVLNLLDSLDVELRGVSVVLAPDVPSSLLGTTRLHWPFTLVGDGGDLHGSAFPPDLYVMATPESESGGSLLKNGAIDPVTGWIRWYEHPGPPPSN